MENSSRIAFFRKRLGYTQQDLADKLGVTKSAVCRYEKEESALGMPLLKKIASALNVPVLKLIGSDDKLANNVYFDSLKENPQQKTLTHFMLDEELVFYFKSLTVGMGMTDYLDLTDEEILSIAKSDELKLMLELIYFKHIKNRPLH